MLEVLLIQFVHKGFAVPLQILTRAHEVRPGGTQSLRSFLLNLLELLALLVDHAGHVQLRLVVALRPIELILLEYASLRFTADTPRGILPLKRKNSLTPRALRPHEVKLLRCCEVGQSVNYARILPCLR